MAAFVSSFLLPADLHILSYFSEASIKVLLRSRSPCDTGKDNKGKKREDESSKLGHHRSPVSLFVLIKYMYTPFQVYLVDEKQDTRSHLAVKLGLWL